jgi:ribonucleoside-diphosphate reductase alpha chain
MAARIASSMRDAAYSASVELAREKGAFPKFDADGYLAPGTFASRLPADIKEASASTASATATCCPSRPRAR